MQLARVQSGQGKVGLVSGGGLPLPSQNLRRLSAGGVRLSLAYFLRFPGFQYKFSLDRVVLTLPVHVRDRGTLHEAVGVDRVTVRDPKLSLVRRVAAVLLHGTVDNGRVHGVLPNGRVVRSIGGRVLILGLLVTLSLLSHICVL